MTKARSVTAQSKVSNQ